MTLPASLYLTRTWLAGPLGLVIPGLVSPWLRRAAPLALTAATIGGFHGPLGVWAAAIATAFVGLVYVWWMRRLYLGLPLDPRWVRWLESMRLIPRLATVEPRG